jgi:hypothetical protein
MRRSPHPLHGLVFDPFRDRDGERRRRGGVRGVRTLAGLTALLLLRASTSFAIGDAGADGRFERRESLHFTLFQDVDLDEHSGLRGSRHFEQRVLLELEAAYDRLGRLLDLRPARKLVVTVWDPALFDARFAGLFRFPAAGFYGGTIHVRGGERVSESLVGVLHHELVHAALDAEAPGFVWPAWLNEGLAEWFEARASGKRGPTPMESALLVRAAGIGALPSLAELGLPAFGGLRPEAAAVAYLASYAFVDFLAAGGGERNLVELWSEIARARSVERGVKRAFGRDLAALEQAFRQTLGAG